MIARKAHWPFIIALSILGPLAGFTFGLYGDALFCSSGCPMEKSERSAPPPDMQATADERPQIRDEATDEASHGSLRLPDGESVALDELAPERPVAIVVMKGAWCPVCRGQLERLSQKLHYVRQTGGAVFGLSDARPAVNHEMMQKLDLGFPVLSDTDHDVIQRFDLWHRGDCKVTPGVVFLDGEGELARMHPGRYPNEPQDEFIIETLAEIDR